MSGFKRCRGTKLAPELEMDHTLDANLRYIIVVEQCIRYAGNAKEKEARCCKEEGAQIGLLGILRDRGTERDECCVLGMLGVEAEGHDCCAYHCPPNQRPPSL